MLSTEELGLITMSELKHRLMTKLERYRDDDYYDTPVESGGDISFFDYEKDRVRYFRLSPASEQWILSRIFWGPSIQGNTGKWSAELAKVLLQLPPIYLMMLNRIFIVREEEDEEGFSNPDVAAACELVGREECEFGDFYGHLGLYWNYESSIIINLTEIERWSKEEVSYSLWGDCWKTRCRKEFYLTVFHELHHLMMANLDWFSDIDIPEDIDDEDGTEQWAQEVYSRIFAEGV